MAERLSDQQLQDLSAGLGFIPTGEWRLMARELLAYRQHGLSPGQVGELLAAWRKWGPRLWFF